MLHGPQRGLFDLDCCLPSECADRLGAGLADIGLVPAIELPRLALDLIPGAGIASHGPVRSILLITKAPPGGIRTLAADTSSRTSTVLAQLVLARRYAAEPRLVAMPPQLETMLAAADAAVIIGDPALRVDIETVPFQVFDLGQEWTAMTGLPMVFGVWAARKGIVTPQLAAAFADSCRFGRERIPEFVASEAARRGIPPSLAREYLTRHIVLELGEREYDGMRLFLRYAADSAMVEPTGKVSA
jgi:predicted solute-binding protein